MIDTGAHGTCVFCEIVAGRIPCDNVAEDATTWAFVDIDPGAVGHLLVIPKQHSADLLSVSPEDLTATRPVAQWIANPMDRQLGAEVGVHSGRGWFTVLTGTAELRLGEPFIAIEAGNAAEFSTVILHALAPIPTSPSRCSPS